MIRNEQEYQAALKRIEQDRAVAEQQRAALQALKLSDDEIETAMEPSHSFHAQLEEEVAWYERVKAGDIETVGSLRALGMLLIALRIAAGLSQRELAQRLGVSEAQVSRDERHEYYGIAPERAQRIVEALGGKISIHVERTEQERELATV